MPSNFYVSCTVHNSEQQYIAMYHHDWDTGTHFTYVSFKSADNGIYHWSTKGYNSKSTLHLSIPQALGTLCYSLFT